MAPEPSSPIINNGKLFSNTKIHDNGELQVPRERQLSHLDPYSDRVSTVLVWKHLVVSTGEDKDKMVFNKIKSCGRYTHKPKILLNNVSGAITGGLWAVMGPSGSGKSTLLNTLACRLDANTVVEGEMRLNGSKYDNAELKRIAGYVMQDDLLNGSLTVEGVQFFGIFESNEMQQSLCQAFVVHILVNLKNFIVFINLMSYLSCIMLLF